MPRMTTTERTAIATPATGLQVFDTTTNTQWFYNGTVWLESGTATLTSKWTNDTTNTRISLTNLSDGSTIRPTGKQFVISDAGKVGIGNAVPLAKLDLSDADGQTYYPTQNGVGLVLNVTGATLNTSGTTTGTAMTLRAIATDDITKTHAVGITSSSETPATGTINYGNLWGISAQAVHRNANTATSLRAGSTYSRNTSTGTVTSQIGSYNSSANESTGTVTTGYGTFNVMYNNNTTGIASTMYGSNNVIQNSGVNTTAYAGNFNVNLAGTATSNDAYGIYSSITKTGTATITNGYGVYVGGVSATNKFAFYSSDTSVPSYFAGKVGIGTTTPPGSLSVLGSGYVSFDRAPSFMNLMLRSAGGTTAAPTALTSGAFVGRLTFDGYDGATWRATGSSYIYSMATENWSSTASGSRVVIATTANGNTTPADRLVVESNGNVAIGSTAPTEKLVVNGAIKIGTTTTATPTAGTIRFNTSTSKFEGYDGTTWVAFH